MTVTVYHYPKCSTCRKARTWLEQGSDAEVRWVHLVEETPDVQTLRSLWQRSGLPLRRFFNTSGRSYRSGGFKERLTEMDEAAMLAALAADGMLIKRPILDGGDFVVVGFKEAQYAEHFGQG